MKHVEITVSAAAPQPVSDAQDSRRATMRTPWPNHSLDAVADWYGTAARDLPWRAPGIDAWAVLVSEVMLQQTPVARVLPVWTAWLQRWPAPADLAAAAPGDAVRMWGKLGYPRRALRLHDCAAAITTRFGGRVPSDVADLESLPGIGAYTARAVAVFAYGHRHPVVDTNVRRVVARAVLGQGDAGPPSTTRDHAAVAALLPDDPAEAARASIALMELGALVCTARAPRCPAARWPQRARGGWPDRRSTPVRGCARNASPAPTGRCAACCSTCCARADGPVQRAALDVVWPDAVAARARAGRPGRRRPARSAARRPVRAARIWSRRLRRSGERLHAPGAVPAG